MPLRVSIFASLMIGLLLCSIGCASKGPDAVAFPGAEGFGAETVGGRGGSVYEVTNLNDDGPGSLRDAVSQPNRTVVFRISGTIVLKSRLDVSQPFITIAGQTAPGDGITLRQHELMIKDTHDVIARFIRCRPGDEAKQEMDALTIWNCKNVIIDHCSLSWSTDSLNDVVKESGNVTVQWCILAEPLCKSVHTKGSHGYATGWDGRKNGGGSFHHNLIAHAGSRAPRIGYFRTGRGLIDCVNNVIYNSGPSYGGETDDFNYVNNYYRPGPSTNEIRSKCDIFEISARNSRMYASGNVWEGREDISQDNRKGIRFAPILPATTQSSTQPVASSDPGECLVDKPFKVVPVTTQSAEVAYKMVLAYAGAQIPGWYPGDPGPHWDAVDLRVLRDVLDRTGKLVNTPADVGGWPELKSLAPPIDSDHDGIPDDWERANGLNANDPGDGAKLSKSEPGCTNLEIYLNDLAASHPGRHF